MRDRGQARQADRMGISCAASRPRPPSLAGGRSVVGCVFERPGRAVGASTGHPIVSGRPPKRVRNRPSRNGSQCLCHDGRGSIIDNKRNAIFRIEMVQSGGAQYERLVDLQAMGGGPLGVPAYGAAETTGACEARSIAEPFG